MKVVDFINRLNKIGFDINTELTFSCIDGATGDWYTLVPDTDYGETDGFSYGVDLTGEEYQNDQIDFCLDVDKCKEYLDSKRDIKNIEFIEELSEVIRKYS